MNTILKKNSLLLITALMQMCFGMAKAGDVIEIGNDYGGSIDILPTISGMSYALTQQIYTQDELGKAQDLTSLSFFNEALESTRMLDIYLVHTDKASFEPVYEESYVSNDWIPFSESDKVFSGEVCFYEEDWTTIPFDTPFSYNGTDNLALIVQDFTGSPSDFMYCRVFESAPMQTLFCCTDNFDLFVNGLNNFDGSIVAPLKNRIKFNDVDNSPERPTGIEMEVIPDGVLVTWEGEGNMWNLQYRLANDYWWTTVDGLTTPNYVITDLIPDESYRVRVQNVSWDGTCSHWLPMSFVNGNSNSVPYNISVYPGYVDAFISWEGNSDSYELWYRTSELDYYDIILYEGFDGAANGMPEGWTTIDADGDGYCWELGSQPTSYINGSLAGNGVWGSYDFAISGSYSEVSQQGLTPDNYLVSPKIKLGGTLVFNASAQEAMYPNEHFGVAISTKTNTNPNHFVTIAEWTLNADGIATESGRMKSQGAWGEFQVDLSAYAGKEGYVAIRHFGCSDQFALDIDDIYIIGELNEVPAGEWNVIETTEPQATIDGLEQGMIYDYKIVGKKAGMEDAATDIYNFYTMFVESLALFTGEDNSGIIEQYDGRLVDVYLYNRTFRKDGTWQTICLPFDLDLEGSVLEGADVRSADLVTKQGNNLIVHCLTPVTTLLAGEPYIIRWDSGGDDIYDPVFPGVVIKTTNNPTSLYKDKVIFRGDYMPTFAPEDNFYIVNGGLNLGRQKLEPGAMAHAFECSFWVDPDLDATIEGIGLNVGNLNETIVGVSPLLTSPEEEEVYNLSGQRLNKLQKGINLLNGRKVLVK